MKIAVIGLGDIAEKAYLPVLTAEAGLELHLMTRDPKKLDRLGERYRLPHRHTTLDGVLGAGVRAAFVHAATSAHVGIVETLLRAGVDVYVDKPLDHTLDGARRLVELADAEGRSLCVGFNRRHAPGYVEAARRDRSLILLQKNRFDLAEDARTFVFDDFVHVVDTLRFLAPGEVTGTRVRHRRRSGDGLLEHVVLELSGEGFTALGIMNRASGSTEEVLEVSGGNGKFQVLNLGDTVDHRDGVPVLQRRGDWTPVARQRGIEQVVHRFLGALRTGERLDGRDALRTHEICELMVREIG